MEPFYLKPPEKRDFFESFFLAGYLGELEPSGVEFVRFLKRIEPGLSKEICALCYLCACAIEDSHTCLKLNPGFLKEYASEKGLYKIFKKGFDFNSITLSLDQFPAVLGISSDIRPMALEKDNLYIQKYLFFEKSISQRLLELSKSPSRSITDTELRILDKLFPVSPISPNWQKLACLNALKKDLLVITGGPGTGKTRTIASIILLLSMSSAIKGSDLRIALSAPTGKAASRLTESIQVVFEAIIPVLKKEKALAGIVEAIYEGLLAQRAITVHRLLGSGKRQGVFRYNSQNPLDFDVIIVDEVSMLDLPMMYHLIDALGEGSKLILVGDKDQLASVEAGNVLSDICKGTESFVYSKEFFEMARAIGEPINKVEGDQKVSDLRDSIITLCHNFRFKEGSGIYELSDAVNNGDFETAFDLLKRPDLKGIEFFDIKDIKLSSFIEYQMRVFVQAVKKEKEPSSALGLLEEFKILCAIKEGPFGNKNLNQFVSNRFFGKNLFEHGLHHGLPIIIRKNDYELGLFNGDIGITWKMEDGLKVAFLQKDGGLRFLAPSRLPRFEPAWAVTVHVSQGSEFKRVLFILPREDSLIIGRELLYTAITRAREKITIIGAKEALRRAITQPTMRMSGLGMRLWGID